MPNSIGIRYVSNPVKRNHRVLENIYKRTVNNVTDAEVQRSCQEQFVWELARHIIAEKLVMYPVIEKQAKDGREIARKRHQEHELLKSQLLEFSTLTPSDNVFKPTLTDLMKDLQKHINEVERQDLVALEGAIEGEQSEGMARSFERTKHFVPVAINAHSESSSPFTTVAELLNAAPSELMDAFRAFPKDDSD